jgi:hypothetical protein
MRTLELLLSGLAMAQAWEVTLFREFNCDGESHGLHDIFPREDECRQPSGLPAYFDAKSIRISDLPPGCKIYMFTDNNIQCLSDGRTNTWEAFGFGVSGCEK